ncbi:hypothetical protein KKC59_04310 [bacterium]|nr:hypothetical protein [bacterium]
MKKSILAFLALCVLSSIVLFYFSVKAYFKIRHNTNEVVFAEKLLFETQEAKTIIEKNMISKDGEIEGVKSEVETEKNKVVELSRKLSEKVNEALVVKDELRKTREELGRVNKELRSAVQKQNEYVKEIDDLKKENKDLKERLDRLKSNLQVSDTGDSMPAVGMPREQSEKGQQTDLVQKKDVGRVLMMDEKFNIVLINLGVVDGLKTSQMLDVIREGQSIAKIRVEKIYDKMASAVILKEGLRVDKILEGDAVK